MILTLILTLTLTLILEPNPNPNPNPNPTLATDMCEPAAVFLTLWLTGVGRCEAGRGYSKFVYRGSTRGNTLV